MQVEFRPSIAWGLHIEDAGLPGDGLRVKVGDHGGLKYYVLRFSGEEELCDWLDRARQALEDYREKKANTPVKVIERALQGSYRDLETQAEMIVEDLAKAGHVIIDVSGESYAQRMFLQDAARLSKIHEFPEDNDDLRENKYWCHPVTHLVWLLDKWGMQDGLGDVWHWAGGWESDSTNYMWPLLSRNDWSVTDVRWNVVEANGPISPVTKSS